MAEDEAGLTILECLRGRLLAERAASKAAKQDEHLIHSKLKVLEAQLRSEAKARKRLEKKLSFLQKKIQSLKIPHHLEESEESRSSSSSSLDHSDSSCISSIASTQEPEQEIQQCPSEETLQTGRECANSDNDSLRRPEVETDDGDVDDSMALVVSSFPEEYSEDCTKKEVKISSENVRDVLGTLKSIREEIQRTMQRRQATRQMIQVG